MTVAELAKQAGVQKISTAPVKASDLAVKAGVSKIGVDASGQGVSTQYDNITPPPPPPPAEDTSTQGKIGSFLGNAVGGLVKGIGTPLAELGLAGKQMFKDVKTLATGQDQGYQPEANIPVIGKVQNPITGHETFGQEAGKILKYGGDVGSLVVGGPELKEGLTGGKAILQGAKQMAGLGAEVGATQEAGNQLEQGQTDVLKGVGNVALGGLKSAAGYAGAGLASNLVGAAARGFQPIAGGMTKKVIGDVTGNALDHQALDAAIKKGIDKGVKPTIVGKKTLKESEAYYKKSTDAIKTVAELRKDLNITDEHGEPVAIPKTSAQAAQAIDQSKKLIFNEYNKLQQSATGRGATFDATPIISRLEEIAKPSNVSFSPEVRKYAQSMIKEVSELNGATPEAIQSRIAELNASMGNIGLDRIGKAKTQVDISVAQELRRKLDSMIENASGAGYADLKARYGALSTIEKDINKRAIVNARQNGKSMADYTDIFTGGEILSGIMTANPAAVLKGLAGKGIKEWYKKVNSPDANIEKMFKKVYNAYDAAGVDFQKATIKPEAKPLLLGAPKPGTPDVSINTPINLPAKSQSTLETAQNAKLSAAQKTKETLTPNSTKLLGAPSSTAQGVPIPLSEKAGMLPREVNSANKSKIIDAEINNPAKAKVKDLSKIDYKKAGSFSTFRETGTNAMIASAENPMGSVADAAANKKSTAAFRKFLDQNNISYKPQKGKYGGNMENSQLIQINNASERKAIDDWLSKNSPQAENIIIKDGKAVRYDPRTKQAYQVDLTNYDKNIALDSNRDDFYSEIDGKKYVLPLYDEAYEKAIDKKSFNDYYNK